MAGEYRSVEVLAQLPEELAERISKGELRIALTSTPIQGAVMRPDLIESLAEAFRKVSMRYYLGLINGDMIPVEIPAMAAPKVWGSGELFFNS